MGMPAHQASPPGGAAQWPYHSFLPLGALPGAIPCARLHTTAVLWEWGMEALAQQAELAVSELVANAVLVEVSDYDPRPPIPTVADPEHDGGRGLLLVAAVSERWGYYYPATDPVSAPRSRAQAPGQGEWLAAPVPAADREPGKVVWALLSPSRASAPG